ncbi:hypothetical protein M0R45_020840 [Rubus argutus]|uniref:non-specific serine/threonine protein kinase n=1 Tax=Rubus argutus TaxID=59490 RepID=A0AAW1XB58_RUBAR
MLLVVKVVVPLTFSILILFLYCLWRKRNSLGICRIYIGRTDSRKLLLSQLSCDDSGSSSYAIQLGKKKDHALPMLSFSCVVASTNNFSPANKLGEGGYGPVYKGNLLQHDIAVKRLSKSSGQGLVEFKNEVQLISQLQHRNLVKILGCCIQREEKILIYEYMPNRSLDSFIFDPIKRRQLNWRQHFGLARIISGNDCRAETKRIVGTFGYMSPEYNATFYESDISLNLLGHAWNLWKSGRCEEMMDPTLAESSSRDGLELCIQALAIFPKPKQPMYSNLMSEVDKALRSGIPSENLLTYSSVVAR